VAGAQKAQATKSAKVARRKAHNRRQARRSSPDDNGEGKGEEEDTDMEDEGEEEFQGFASEEIPAEKRECLAFENDKRRKDSWDIKMSLPFAAQPIGGATVFL
jgi:hypothetical protein